MKIQHIVLFCSILTIVFCAGMLLSVFILTEESGSKINMANENISRDIFVFSEKINNEVADFFYYNTSNKDDELTDDELKEQGGVCWHYTDYYIEQTLNLTNFYAKKIKIDIDGNATHVFAVISNKNGYCVLDQSERWCVPFEI